jgi:hypothetical protein
VHLLPGISATLYLFEKVVQSVVENERTVKLVLPRSLLIALSTKLFSFFKIKMKVLFDPWRVTERGSRLSDPTAMLTVLALLLYAVRDVIWSVVLYVLP